MTKGSTFLIQAIILKNQPWREHDSQVVVFSNEEGKLRLNVRGAMRSSSKLVGHLQPFTLSELMVIKGKSSEYVGGAMNTSAHWNLRQGFNKMRLTGKLFNLFHRLVRNNQPDNDLFFLLKSLLTELDRTVQDLDEELYQLYYLAFFWKLITILGYGPELYTCGYCKKAITEKKNFFQLDKASVICGAEAVDEYSLPASADTIRIMRFLINSDLSKIKNLKVRPAHLKEAVKIAKKFLLYHFEDYLK